MYQCTCSQLTSAFPQHTYMYAMTNTVSLSQLLALVIFVNSFTEQAARGKVRERGRQHEAR